MTTEILSNMQAYSLLCGLSYVAGCGDGVTNVEFRNGPRERGALPPARAKDENVSIEDYAKWSERIDRMFDLATHIVWFERDGSATVCHNLTFRSDGNWDHEYEVVS